MKTILLEGVTKKAAACSGAVVLITLLPFGVSAQTDIFTTSQTISAQLLTLIGTFSAIAFIAMLAFFFWGLAKFIWGGAEDKAVAKNMLIWGVVALFVASSIWGIVYVLRDTFGVGNQTSIPLPGAV
jgi:hypothetical protein